MDIYIYILTIYIYIYIFTEGKIKFTDRMSKARFFLKG